MLRLVFVYSCSHSQGFTAALLALKCPPESLIVSFNLGSVLPALRLELGTVAFEARTLPLRHAVASFINYYHCSQAFANDRGLLLHPPGLQVVQLQDPPLGPEQGVVRVRGCNGDSRIAGGLDRRVSDDLRAMPEPTQKEDQSFESGGKKLDLKHFISSGIGCNDR